MRSVTISKTPLAVASSITWTLVPWKPQPFLRLFKTLENMLWGITNFPLMLAHSSFLVCFVQWRF